MQIAQFITMVGFIELKILRLSKILLKMPFKSLNKKIFPQSSSQLLEVEFRVIFMKRLRELWLVRFLKNYLLILKIINIQKQSTLLKKMKRNYPVW